MLVRRLSICSLTVFVLSACGHSSAPPVMAFQGSRVLAEKKPFGVNHRVPGSVVDGFESVPLPVQTKSGYLLLAGGTDGNVWFSDFDDNLVGYVNTSTHAYGTFVVPNDPNDGSSASPFAMRAANGTMYFGDSYGFGTAVQSGVTLYNTEFFVNGGYYGGANDSGDIAPVKNGSLYFGSHNPNAIGSQSTLWNAAPSSSPAQEIAPPNSTANITNATLGSDGNIYFADLGNKSVGRYDVSTGIIDTDKVQMPGKFTLGPSENVYNGPDNYIWVCGLSGSATQWIHINPSTLSSSVVISGFYHGGASCPNVNADGAVSGSDSALWWVTGGTILQRVTNSTHQYSTYDASVLGSDQGMESIAAGPDGNIWFYDDTNSVGVFHMQTISTMPASVRVAIGTSKTVSIAEVNYTGSFSLDAQSQCSGLAAVKKVSANKFTVKGLAAGTCFLVFDDALPMAKVYVLTKVT